MRRALSSLPLVLVLALVGLVSFGATAFAADQVASTDSSLLDVARPLYDAFSGGHYAYAAALLVVLLVAAAKRASARYLGDRAVKWLHSDAGGSLLALTAAAASAAAAGLAAPGAHVTLALLKTALLVGVGAAGGYAMLKNLVIEPILKPLQARAPGWMQPAFTVLMWIFDKPDAVKQAEAAGQAAVDAAPAPGAAAAVGQPSDVK